MFLFMHIILCVCDHVTFDCLKCTLTADTCAEYDCSGRGHCVMFLGTTPRCVCDTAALRDSSGQYQDCDEEVCSDGQTCQNGGIC